MDKIDILAAVVSLDDGESRPSPHRLLAEKNICEEDWRPHFGSWDRVMVAAGLRPAPIVRRLERQAGQHFIDQTGVDEIDAEVKGLTGLYADGSTKRHQWILVASDVHDVKVDPFWLHTFLETVRLTTGTVDTIVLNGDIWDGHEYSRHASSPAEWQLGRRVKFVHNFLNEIRQLNPSAQIVFVEGNHEHWILRYFNEKAPQLMPLFADLHGFSSVADLLGIHRYGITYCSQASLRTPTLSKTRRDINQSNSWVFKDTVRFTHYRPSDRDITQPGVNGHEHSFQYHGPFYRSDIGRFNWMQIGCGCRALESWTEGQKWDRGFGLVEWDEDDREQRVRMHMVPVSDKALVAGMPFRRDPERDIALYMRLGGFTERELDDCYRHAHAI